MGEDKVDARRFQEEWDKLPMTDQKQAVRLPDGSVLELGARQLTAISTLNDAISNVVSGETHSLSVVEIVGAARKTRRALITISSEGLDQIADALLEQSKLARHAAASWEGMPFVSRSYLEH
jgi:hypothetical protein